MKKRIIASLAILAFFGLAIVTYAYNQPSNTTTAKPSCCKKSDSCPMKAKMVHEKTTEHASESCPMKAQTASTSTAGEHNACDCCCDLCPMKKGGGAKATAASATETGKDCCDCCDCCKGKSDTAA